MLGFSFGGERAAAGFQAVQTLHPSAGEDQWTRRGTDKSDPFWNGAWEASGDPDEGAIERSSRDDGLLVDAAATPQPIGAHAHGKVMLQAQGFSLNLESAGQPPGPTNGNANQDRPIGDADADPRHGDTSAIARARIRLRELYRLRHASTIQAQIARAEQAIDTARARLALAEEERDRAVEEKAAKAAARVAAKTDADAKKLSERKDRVEAKERAKAEKAEYAKARAEAKLVDTPDVAALVQRFNRKFMVVNENGRAIIYTEVVDPILRRKCYDRLTFRDFEQLYLNESVQVGMDAHGLPVFKNVANVWLHHRDRKQCISGVVFDPTTTEARPGILNLWNGFAVPPVAGNWSLLRSHLRSIICDSHDDLFAYVMGWMAYMVQHPDRQGEVAIVMRGVEGTGKGTLVKALLHIFGQHGIAINNAKHLVGNFNGHLRDVVLLFADEAFYAGDRQHVGALKAIITEPQLTIEAKFQNATQVPNFLHLIMASNEEWVVPASLSARRFCVLNVPDTVKSNHEYFAAIWKQMETGGYEAMLYDLIHYDLTDFNVREAPITAGLLAQKKLSLGATEKWWIDVLQRGYVFRSRLGLEEVFSHWHAEVATGLLFDSYQEFARDRRERHILSRESLGAFMRGMGGRKRRLLNAPIGEHVVDKDNPWGGKQRTAEAIKHPRPSGYHLGTLEESREAFNTATGLKMSWEDQDD